MVTQTPVDLGDMHDVQVHFEKRRHFEINNKQQQQKGVVVFPFRLISSHLKTSTTKPRLHRLTAYVPS